MAQLAELNVKINGDGSGAQQALRRTAFEANKLDAATRKAAKANEELARSAFGSKSSIDKLARGIDKNYRNTKLFESAQKELSTALARGNISQDRHNELLQRAATHYGIAQGKVENFNLEVRASRFATGNLAAQLNDIGVMLAAGQSPLTLAVQQGTQVSQVFNQMGSKKEMIASLGAAFKQFINPVSLLTVGVIAGGAALVQFGLSAMGASESTNDFKDRVQEAEKAVKDLSRENELMQWGVSETEKTLMENVNQLQAEYLKLAERAKNVQMGARADAEARVEAARLEFIEAQNLLAEYRNVEVINERLTDQQEEQARLLQEEQEWLKAQAEQQLLINRAMIATALTATGLVDTTGTYVVEMTKVFNRASDLREELGDAAYEALNLAGVDIFSPIDAGTRAAAALAGQLGIALATARQINIARAAPYVSSGRGTVNPGDENSGAFVPTPEVVAAADAMINPKAIRGGGGGGGKSETDKIREDTEKRLLALQEGFMSERELEEQAYKEQQELMQSALEQKLLTQKEYDELMQKAKSEHVAAMGQLEASAQASSLQGWSDVFGNIASVFQAGGEKMVGITKAFSIAQGLLNSYRAYTEVLADPSLVGRPFLRQALAASTLAAGLAQVANMRSTSTSGGGGGGGAASATQGTFSGPTQTMNVNLQGDVFSRTSVEGLLKQMQEFLDRGGRLVFS